MKFLRSLRVLFSKQKTEADMAEELRAHLEARESELMARGLSREEASYAARRQFGGVDQIKEIAREERSRRGLGVWLGNLGRDFRFSFRSLRRAPGFGVAVIVTLGLCIGANTTIFSVLYGMILKPLPFRDAGQLVEVYNSLPKMGQLKRPVSIAQYVDYKANADKFEGFGLWSVWTYNIGEDTDPERGIGARVTADYFSLVDARPLLGRFFTMEESVPGKDRVVVLTQDYWEKSFHADPTVIGREIRLSGDLHTIIGVAPRSLNALNVDQSLFKPYAMAPAMGAPDRRLALDPLMYARLKPGVTPAAGLAQLAAIEQHYHDEVAPAAVRDFLDRRGFRVELGRVRVEQTKPVRTALLLLQGGALFVLLLGSVNVASLMLARANARQGELAVRQALGAGRGALVRQLLTESLLLVLAGAALGTSLAWASLRVINTYTTAIVREIGAVGIDDTVLGLTLLVSLGVALLIALLPVVRMWSVNLVGSLQSGARGASAGGRTRAMGGVLVTLQVALALMLLVGACLLIRSFARVMAIDPGFQVATTMTGRVALNASYKDGAAMQSVQDRIIAGMREIPGVEAAAVTGSFPLYKQFPVGNLPLRGAAVGPTETLPNAYGIQVTPEYFDVMGIRILEGRGFTAADRLPRARPVFIVDRNFEEKYFPGRSAIGETLAGPANQKPEQAPIIIGVAAPAKLSGMEDVSGIPFVYQPLGIAGAFSVVVRSHRSLAELTPLMRQKVRTVDPTLPLYGVTTLQTFLHSMLANRRGVMLLLAAFAAIALLLAAVGIYGMLAYDVTQRTREIGIRGAIGASRGQIMALILRQGLGKTALGLVIGLAGAFALSRYMGSLLFDVRPSDPVAFGAVSVLLLLVALLASWLPARRAAKVDPIVALRTE